MAEDVVASENKVVADLAASIIEAQKLEISMMSGMLNPA
jgi:uncharacterized protein (DUF305 family)